MALQRGRRKLAHGAAQSGSTNNRQALIMVPAPPEILPFHRATLWHFSQQSTRVTTNLRACATVPNVALENWVVAT